MTDILKLSFTVVENDNDIGVIVNFDDLREEGSSALHKLMLIAGLLRGARFTFGHIKREFPLVFDEEFLVFEKYLDVLTAQFEGHLETLCGGKVDNGTLDRDFDA